MLRPGLSFLRPDVSSIATPRLLLRRLTLDDAELMLSIWTDPDFLRHVGDRGVQTVDQARDAIADGALLSYAEFGYGPYHVALRDGTAIGVCGLYSRAELDHPDLGFAMLSPYRRQGYAYEAALAVLKSCHEDLDLHWLYAIVAPANKASRALIEKLGMNYDRPVQLDGDDSVVSLYRLRLSEEEH
ncbi:MAG: GNAT family N-acetyltransferase [Woeseiaceae bacterium]|nr:GNAT family N-acetyltransferase [Woeseiaceae bacterium]